MCESLGLHCLFMAAIGAGVLPELTREGIGPSRSCERIADASPGGVSFKQERHTKRAGFQGLRLRSAEEAPPAGRPVHRGPEVFLWKARERDGREKPTTSTKRSGQFPKNPSP